MHIITRLDPGGSTTNTIISADRLRKHGFDTALACGVTNEPGVSKAAGILGPGVPLFLIPDLVRDISPVRDLLAMRDIRRLLRRESFDLVHVHTSKAGVLGRLAARSCGLPVVHTPHGHVFYGYFGRILTALFVFVERAMARHAARIVSLTDRETAESLARGIGRPEQYVTIPSGVPIAAFRQIPAAVGLDFRAKAGIPADAFLFVSVGHLVRVKGFDILLAAFARVKGNGRPVFLAIAGNGEGKPSLEAMARELGIADRVLFAGELADIRGLLSAGNAFALASRNEGMGRVYVEAMAAGLPVIGTAVGGVPVLIEHGVTGLLVPPEMPEAMASAMEQLVANRETCLRLGQKAAGAVYPDYDEDTMIEKLAKLYGDVLRETRK